MAPPSAEKRSRIPLLHTHFLFHFHRTLRLINTPARRLNTRNLTGSDESWPAFHGLAHGGAVLHAATSELAVRTHEPLAHLVDLALVLADRHVASWKNK